MHLPGAIVFDHTDVNALRQHAETDFLFT